MPEPIVQTGNINKSYQWAIETCNAPNVGYSMEHRYQETINGITYYDCSSFIWYALKAGGFIGIGDRAFTTHTYSMQYILPRAGFTEYNAGEVEWLPGDIVIGRYQNYEGVLDYQHTEMVYQGTGNIGEGYLMGAHGAWITDGVPRPLAQQVSIKTTLDYGSVLPSPNKYTKLYRFGNGASGYGLTLAQVAGMCGNAWMESTVNPSAYGHSVPQDFARGLWSWTDWSGEHPFYIGTAMVEWVEDRYGVWTNGNGQIACAIEDDLPTGSMWTNTDIPQYTYTNAEYPDFQSFLDAKTIDAEEACLQWFLHWESPVSYEVFIATWNERLRFANLAYTYIQEHANDTDITDWIQRDPPNHYLTEAEALNNCVLIWRFASAGGGGGGNSSRRKTKYWMYLRRRRGRNYD